MSITVNQIAEKCNVSRTTVLRALNNTGSVGKETREKILAVAEEYHYRPNLLARSLHHGRTMSIGVVTISVENLYFVQSLQVINKEAERRGYFTNIVVCDDSPEGERKLIQGLADRQMEGILLSPLNKGKDFEAFLQSLNIPVVCMGNQVSDAFTTVQVDERAAAQEAAGRIAAKGYRRLAFICPPLSMGTERNIYVHEQRLLGVEEAAKQYKDVEFAVIKNMDYLSDLPQQLQRGRTAFLCSGDSYALNVMQWANLHGLRIPDDFGLMGFDDINVLDYISPKLTTVSTNVEGVATTAVTELLQQIEAETYAPKSIYLKYQILERETL